MKSKEHALEKEDISRLFKACSSGKETFLTKILTFTGVRVGEFLHLNEKWVDYRREMIKIPRNDKCGRCGYCRQKRGEYQKRLKDVVKGDKTKKRLKSEDNYLNGYWVVKTEEAVRSIPFLNNEVSTLLENFFKDHTYVWEVYNNKVYTWRMCREIGKRFDKIVTPHTLRATYATRMAQEGVSSANLQSLLGWSSISTAISYIRKSGRSAQREIKRKKIGKRFY